MQYCLAPGSARLHYAPVGLLHLAAFGCNQCGVTRVSICGTLVLFILLVTGASQAVAQFFLTKLRHTKGLCTGSAVAAESDQLIAVGHFGGTTHPLSQDSAAVQYWEACQGTKVPA